MRALLSVLVICTCAAQSAFAGAWLREPGSAFVSFGNTVRYGDGVVRHEYGFYGEHGVGPRLTLGLDINERPGIAGHVLVFARVPLWQTSGNTKISFELGVGVNHRAGLRDKIFKSTLSVGRGFSSRWGDGWLNLDAGLELRLPDRNPAFKLDATVGLSGARRLRPLLQIESTYTSGEPLIWSIIPGVMINRRNNATWVIGLERKSPGQTGLGLRFAIWRRF